MADISILSRLVLGYTRNVDISQNALVVGSLKVGSSSPVEITKAIATKLIAIQTAADADGTYDTRYNTKAILASATTGQGASLVGIEDAGGYFTGTKVEAALQELGAAMGSGDASGIDYDNSGGDLSATNVQDAIDELDDRVIATETVANAAIPLTQKGANNGVATLGAGGKIPASQLPSTVMEFKGNWDANANTPTLIDGTGDAGDVYRVNTAGTQDLGSGSQTFAIGDWVVYNGTIWQKSINSNTVVSVNGQQGVVVLDTDDIAEGSALYFTTERAQDAIGAMVADSATVALAYVDGDPSLTASVVDGSIDEDKLSTDAADQDTILGGAGTKLHIVSAPLNKKTIVAGESMGADLTFGVRLAVNGETAGRYYKADIDASVSNKFFVIGLAKSVAGASAGNDVPMTFSGTHTLGANDTPFASGDIGKPVYLTAAGSFSLTAPSAVDTAVMRVGIVETTTKIFVDRQLHGIN